MTKVLNRILLTTVLVATACGSSKPATPDASGGAGTNGAAGGGGTSGAGTSGGGTSGGGTSGGGTSGGGTNGADAAAGTMATGNDGGSDATDATASEGGTDVATTTDGGADASAATTKRITAAAGGTVTADGLTVVIPAGALAADTDITVAISDGTGLPAAASLTSKVYDLGPSGTTFLKPVGIAIDFTVAKVAAPKVATLAFLQAGAWVALADSSTNGAKASATTTHFTPFGVVNADPVIAACVGMAKAACQACCKTTFPSGESKVIPSIIQTCGCAVGAPCNALCAANLCMGLAFTTECKACFDAETSKSQSPCFDQGLIACQANSDCKSYETCGLSCQ